mmetsp:Transcript_21413/g.50697  ORF Transcript_21413/g.50697 Transcript_21413/m.50697 type:complete len:278 (+) Transcript_21413:14-847(+)
MVRSGLRLSLLCIWLVGSAGLVPYNLSASKFCKSHRFGHTYRCADVEEEPLNELDDLAVHYGTDKATSDHGYTLIYNSVLAPMRGSVRLLLEIGCLRGSSARMWAEFFQEATIVCVDKDKNAKKTHDPENRILVLLADQGLKRRCRRSRRVGIEHNSRCYPYIAWATGHYRRRRESRWQRHRHLVSGAVARAADGRVVLYRGPAHTQHDAAYTPGGGSALVFLQQLQSSLVFNHQSSQGEKEPWLMHIKDIHVYGGSGLAILHKGQWTALDGSGNQP